MEEAELALDGGSGLPLQHLEQQAELGGLDRLGVDIDAVDVGEQDALLLGGGELPLAGAALDELLAVLLGMLRVGRQVPVEQVLVGADEEGTAAAGRVEDAQEGRLLGREPLEQA